MFVEGLEEAEQNRCRIYIRANRKYEMFELLEFAQEAGKALQTVHRLSRTRSN